MNYEEFCIILNKHIFEGEKKELLRNLANNPERFLGFFRPTKPKAKILQHLLQSHEIKMGDALEEIISELLKTLGFSLLPKNLTTESNETLSLDQYFTDGKRYYFIEQKVRDDHDSTKKRGQISNFKAKLEVLHKENGSLVCGIMYFIDPDLVKNKNYYLQELKRLGEFYGVSLNLFYGKELFAFFQQAEVWDNIISYLEKWKDSLPELPEVNFDLTPEESFEEIKGLEVRYWRKILENEKLWENGVMGVIFKNGSSLNMLKNNFYSQKTAPHQKLSFMLDDKLRKYYR